MRYGTWIVLFTDNPAEGGTTPDALSGIFYFNNTETNVAGYIPEDTVITDLAAWDVTEITETQFLDLAKTVNPLAHMDENGYLVFPYQTFTA